MKSNTITIAFANNKGGSGKTTTCANIGYALSILGKKVLLIDGDMQMNLSLSFFDEEQVLSFAESEKNLYHAIRSNKDLTDYIYPTEYENLYLIPASPLMSQIEMELFTMWQREFILKKGLAKIKESGVYDYILIDAPPTLGAWVMNVLTASDQVLVPVEASPWGLFGLANLFDFLEKVKPLNPDLSLLGIAVTKLDTRKSYYRQSLEILHQVEDVHVFSQAIRIDSAIEWAQDSSKPIMAYKKSARSAGEYLELAKEVDERCR